MRQSDRNGVVATWDLVDKSVFLLSGFALENAIKSFLVYENPQWISNGRLARQLRSHSLTSLQRQSTQIPFKNRFIWVLEQFEDGLESWARYPCSLSVESSTYERAMEVELWRGYVRLMRAYGNRMADLLSHEWHGPNEFRGSWTLKGGFLEMTEAEA